MEVIELIIFIGVAILLGSMVIGFIAGWDYQKSYQGLKKVFFPERQAFQHASIEDFAADLADFFSECRSSGIDTVTSKHVDGNGSITKEALFDYYKSINWCATIQSLNQSCGVREDVNITTAIALPAVVTVNCTNLTIYLS